MAYINFKEEKFAGNKEIKNRILNNKKIYKTIINNKSNISIQYDSKYSFKTIEGKTLNNSKVKNEQEFLIIRDKYIVCSEFINCKIYNIHFIGCKFIGCNFINCDFGGGGVIFENCVFILQEINHVPSLNVKDNFSTTFKECKMYVKFLSCDISYLLLEDCNIKNTNFELTDMTSAIINRCNLKKIELIDVNMSGFKMLESYIEDLEFNDKYISKVDEKTFFDKIPFKSKTKNEYDGIYKIYETYANIFKQNTLNNNFGEYYYLCKLTQMKGLKGKSKFISLMYFITCGYGERIINAIITSLAIVVVFTILYLLIGIRIDNNTVCYLTGNSLPKTFIQFLKQINESFHLSMSVFGAVGCDFAKPLERAYLLSDVEMSLGIIMTGIGIGTLTRKVVR